MIDGRPGYVSRNWIYLTIAATSLLVYRQYSYKLPDLETVINAATDFGRNFYHKYIEDALLKFYYTINSTQDPTIANIKASSLAASENSLGHMVVDFNMDNVLLSKSELDELYESARHGDLSSVLPYYEKSIRHPINNALFGDLVRLLLIQVQKQVGITTINANSSTNRSIYDAY